MSHKELAWNFAFTTPFTGARHHKQHSDRLVPYRVGFYRPLWIAACALNSSYSYFWDVERDWEIAWFTNTRGVATGRPREHFQAWPQAGPGNMFAHPILRVY